MQFCQNQCSLCTLLALSFALENIRSDKAIFVSAGKGSEKSTLLHSLKDEEFEKANSASKAGTWITTTPLGIRVGTEGATRMDLKPLLMYQATSPADETVLLLLCDYSTVCKLRDRAAITSAVGFVFENVLQVVLLRC